MLYVPTYKWPFGNQQTKSGPPRAFEDICQFGWNKSADSVMPAIASEPVCPPTLLDVVSCSGCAQGTACSQHNCKCHNDQLSCTEYYGCEGSDH